MYKEREEYYFYGCKWKLCKRFIFPMQANFGTFFFQPKKEFFSESEMLSLSLSQLGLLLSAQDVVSLPNKRAREKERGRIFPRRITTQPAINELLLKKVLALFRFSRKS